VQMPEMDGLEATRQIVRHWPRPSRPWIVAMTANAMQGDREMCIQAGMDDYLAKPIRIEELVEALSKAKPLIEEDQYNYGKQWNRPIRVQRPERDDGG